MKRLALLLPLLALAAALRAAAAGPFTTTHADGWGVDDRSAAPGGGVTATELPPALRGARRAEVPATLAGRPVTALAPGLFAGCTNLAEAALPASLAAIPDDCFRGCRRLRGVAIPAGAESVGERAFEGCAALRRIALPDGVRSLGRRALADCANLREADLGRCAEVGAEALAGCARLERVRFPEAPGATLGERALADCRSLREARLGAGAAAVGASAFEGCAALEGVELPPTVESIGERALAGCAALRVASMPAGEGGGARALRIGAGAFEGCPALVAAAFGATGPLELEEGAFRDCTALREARFGASSGRLAPAVFRGCRSLCAATVPPGVTELPEKCFADCSALVSLRLPPTLVSVGARALRGCTALRRLELPSAEVRFARDALAGCDALIVAWPSDDPATAAGVPARELASRGMVAGAPRSGAAPAGPAAATGAERVGPVLWSWRPAPEGDGAEIVGAEPVLTAGLFRDFPEGAIEWLLEQGDLTVPETLGGMPVAALGPGALRGLGPMRVAVPASVRRVGAGAIAAAGLEGLSFAGAPPALDPEWIAREPGDDDPLDYLEYPAAFAREWETALDPPLPSARPGAAGAAEGAFVGEEEALGVRWTYSVRDGRAWVGAGPGRPAVPPGTAGALEIPERLGGLPVGGIAPCAFLGMDRIGSVRVGGARRDFEIGDLAFRDCSALTNLSWDADCDVASIGAEALRGCTALARLDARGVRRFGAAAFAGCTALRSLRVGAGRFGGPDALPPLFAAGCTALDDMELPVGSIGRGAFRGCSSLRAVWISPSLRVLGADAFAGCTALRVFGTDPSAGCSPWRRPNLPEGCTRVGPRAFDRTPLAPAADGAAAADAPEADPFGPPAALESSDEDANSVAALAVAPARLELPPDVPSCATLRVSLAGIGDPDVDRAPANLALVLDRSAAMRGEPFERARDAVLDALPRLRERDVVTVVAFGRRAEILADAEPATPRTRAALAARLRALEPDAADPVAALFGGVAAGAAGLRKGAALLGSGAAGAVPRLVLVSGSPTGAGHAGPDAPGDFHRLGESLAKEGFAVSAVGAAPGCPADALAALAEGSGGSFLAPGTPAAAAAAAAAEIDAALRVAATAATLAVRFRGGARPVAASGAGVALAESALAGEDSVRAILGPVVLGRETALDIRVEFPARAPGETAPFARAEASWILPDGRIGGATATLSATFSEPR